MKALFSGRILSLPIKHAQLDRRPKNSYECPGASKMDKLRST